MATYPCLLMDPGPIYVSKIIKRTRVRCSPVISTVDFDADLTEPFDFFKINGGDDWCAAHPGALNRLSVCIWKHIWTSTSPGRSKYMHGKLGTPSFPVLIPLVLAGWKPCCSRLSKDILRSFYGYAMALVVCESDCLKVVNDVQGGLADLSGCGTLISDISDIKSLLDLCPAPMRSLSECIHQDPNSRARRSHRRRPRQSSPTSSSSVIVVAAVMEDASRRLSTLVFFFGSSSSISGD
ncbi:hypothetical protein ACLB2K_035468 [Fragaria x ananassa]